MYVSTDSIQYDDPACLFQPEKVKCKTWDFALQTVIDKNLYWVYTIYMENLIAFGSQPYAYLTGMSKSSRNITVKCVTFCNFTCSFKIHARKYLRNLQITVADVHFQDTLLELYNVKVHFKNIQFVNTTISDRPQALPWKFSELILILEGVNSAGSHIDKQLTAFQFDHVNSLIIEIYQSSLSYIHVKSLVENM